MILDASILLAFIIYSITVGLIMRKKASRGLEDYFLAGKSLKGWQAGTSMAATQFAADTPLLVTGLVATAGLFSLWRLWIYAIAFLLMGFLLGGPWRRSGVITDAELTEIRYGGKGALVLRALKAFHMGTIVNCVVMAMVLLAATRVAEPFLTWHEWLPSSFIDPLAQFLAHHDFRITSLALTDPNVWLLSADNLITILAIMATANCTTSVATTLRSPPVVE